MDDDATAAVRLAGFALAHAAWSIEGGETLCTLAMVDAGRESIELRRYEADSIPESVGLAHLDLKERLENGGHAALVIDGFFTSLDGERTDALIVELVGLGGRTFGNVIQRYQAGRRSRVPFVGRASCFAILGEPIVSDEVNVPDAERILLESAREHPHAGRLFTAGSGEAG